VDDMSLLGVPTDLGGLSFVISCDSYLFYKLRFGLILLWVLWIILCI